MDCEEHICTMNDSRRTQVWIIGSSIMLRLRAYLSADCLDENLDLDCDVIWDCMEERRWEDLLPLLYEKQACSARDPAAIIIHLGGNNVGLPGTTRIDLLRRMKVDITKARMLFPETNIMFSGILPRRYWRYQQAASGYPMERTRRWLNGAMSGYMAELGMRCIWHRQIHLQHVGRDGVHLNVEGNKLLKHNLHKALECELQN